MESNNAPLTVRGEGLADAAAIRALHLRAFGEDSPGALVDDLREAGSCVISIVAVQADRIVGHVLFSRIEAPMPALTLAPVGVCPSVQRIGIGSLLIREGLRQAEQSGWQAVFVLGDPAYYERFGFKAAAVKGYSSPYRGPGFMVQLLNKTAPTSGTLIFPTAFGEDIKEHQAREAVREASL